MGYKCDIYSVSDQTSTGTLHRPPPSLMSIVDFSRLHNEFNEFFCRPRDLCTWINGV